jgi:hypothetical protein
LKLRSIATAALCTGLVLLWQFWAVDRKFADNWTALYYTGDYTQAPPALGDEDIYRFHGSAGFDGQFYHFIAHDPWMRQGSERYVDNPRLRWRRILLPALAWGFALGNGEFVDSAYFGWIAAFTFLGAYWLSLYCLRCGLTPWWGAAFALIPAVIISLERGTVDVALAALCCGFAVYAEDSWLVYPVLAAAPLARETGICLIAAYAAVQVWRRAWSRAALGATMALPFLAWTVYLNAHTVVDRTVFASYVPLAGLAERTLHPISYAAGSAWLAKAAALDYVAVLGIWAALILAVVQARATPIRAAAVAFAGVAVFLAQPQAWGETYAFGRTMSPLLIFVALAGIERRWWWALTPMVMVLPRILFQIKSTGF